MSINTIYVNPSSLDLFFRGAAAALMLFHIIHALHGGLAFQQRNLFMAFAASIVGYLLSDPNLHIAPNALWIVALSLCLLAAPLLLYVIQTVFDDYFIWTTPKLTSVAVTFAVGWMSNLGMGGVALGAAHKILLLSFAAAAFWTVIRDWQSDLVARRRWLRSWVAGGLAIYVFFVLSFELVFIRSTVPQSLMVLNLVFIASTAMFMALAFARRPLREWLRSDTTSEAIYSELEHKAQQLHTEKFTPNRSQIISQKLTRTPASLDKKAALRERLLQTMGEQRAYATEALSLAKLAEKLNATPAQLREAINQHLGYRNFNDFLHHYRIDEASQRLQTQDLPILSIALDVGYGSIGPFNRAFKQIKGITPSEFKARS